MGLFESVILAVVTAVLGVVSYIAKCIYNDNQKLNNQLQLEKSRKESAVEAGLACILRSDLMDMHEKYISLGYITIHGKETWDKMYISYHELGGNGLIEDFNDDIQGLLIRRLQGEA